MKAIAPLAALLAFFASALTSPRDQPSHVDDAWFLHVSSRVADGETLYRDTFCGVLPLAFYVHGAAARLFGNTPALLQMERSVLFGAAAWWMLAIGGRLGLTVRAQVLLAPLLLLWGLPVRASPYSLWALVFLLAVVYCVLRWQQRPANAWAAAAGIGAGLCFASKQNVGLLAFAALALVLAPGRRKQMALAVSCGIAAVAPFLLAIAGSGAWPWFLAQGFGNKPVYLSRFSRLTLEGVLNLTPAGEFREHGLTGLLEWSPNSIYWAMPVAVMLLACWRRDRAAGVTGLFAVASIAATLPVPDAWHVLLAVPLVAVSAAHRIASLGPRMATVALAAAGCIAAAYVSWAAAHVKAAVTVDTRPLVAASDGGRMLVIHPAAPVFYHAALRNPTRYDFPLVTPFGRNGQREVIGQIRDGSVSRVCLEPPGEAWLGLPPEELIAFVQSSMTPGPDLGPCRLYLRASGPGLPAPPSPSPDAELIRRSRSQTAAPPVPETSEVR